MLTYINIDAILSDPLMITATALLVVGPILFLVSVWKLIRTPKKKDPLFDPSEPNDEISPAVEKKSEPPATAPAPAPSKPLPPIQPITFTSEPMDMDKTVVMPAGVPEIQGQLEIAFSQIKHLNKKIFELENVINSLPSTGSSSSQNAMLELPTNPADFAQKLLKLAEHVIVLEKNVARLMGNKAPAMDTSSPPAEPIVPSSKPPIMPL